MANALLSSSPRRIWCGSVRLGLRRRPSPQPVSRGSAQFEQALLRHPLPQPWRAALGGVLVGAIAIWIPEVAGNEYEPPMLCSTNN